MNMIFADRSEAGYLLGRKLVSMNLPGDPIVIGIAPGGLVVAFEVAEQLQAPLDFALVRHVRCPDSPGVSIGAVGMRGVPVLDEILVKKIRASRKTVRKAVALAEQELAQIEREYLPLCEKRSLEGHVVILVDDGIVTGNTLLTARKNLPRGPDAVYAAAPVGRTAAIEDLFAHFDAVAVLGAQETLNELSSSYLDSKHTTDEEVLELLRTARSIPP